jgi:hypothetical protein
MSGDVNLRFDTAASTGLVRKFPISAHPKVGTAASQRSLKLISGIPENFIYNKDSESVLILKANIKL